MNTLIVAAIRYFLLFVVPTVTYGISAQWELDPISGDWNTAANWMPNGVPNGPADIATFGLSHTTSVSISSDTEVNATTFTAAATNHYIVTSSLGLTLTISGVGVVNNSGTAQNFETTDGGEIRFSNNATAGTNVQIDNLDGSTNFFNHSNAGSAGFYNDWDSSVNFFDSSNAGNAYFGTNGGVYFFDSSTAGNAEIQTYDYGYVYFAGISSAGNAGISIIDDATLVFADSSTAGNANIGATGWIEFGSSNGGNASIGVSCRGGRENGVCYSWLGTLNFSGLTIGSIWGDGLVQGGHLTVGGGAFWGDWYIGALTKISPGTLDLTGANIFGGIEVDAGRLQVGNTSGSPTGSGSVIVDSGAILSGYGTIEPDGDAAVTNFGTIAPSGQLNVNGNLQLGSSSNLSFRIGGTTPVTGYDLLGTPALVLNGALTVSLINGFTPQQSDTFTILSTQALLRGVLTSVNNSGRLNTTDGSGSFVVNYLGVNNITLSDFGPPSPVVIAVSASPVNGGSVIGGQSYPSGASVTVMAIPNTGYTFTNWKQNGSYIVSHSASYTFTASGDRTLVAHFTTNPVTITTRPSPSDGGTTTGDGTYTSGGGITVEAIPRIGYTFTNWTENGTIVSQSASYAFRTNINRNLVANFTDNPVTVTTSMSPSNAGTTTGDGTYATGANVTVTAAATAGYSFSNWTENGAVVSASASYSFTATTSHILVANFVPTVQVTVQTTPAGRTFSVDGTTYSSTQTFSWVRGSSHTIATTSPQSGATGIRYVWMNWSGGGAISHTVAPTTNTTYTANFRTQYFLTMAHGTGGTVSPGSGWRNSGATVSISATPASGYSFSNWTGSGAGSYSGTNNPASITMNGPVTEIASFTHNAVQVTVRTNPAGRSFTVDGTPYISAQTFSWVPGSSHTIATTSPQSGGTGIQYAWTNWTGGGAISHTVAPTSNTTYTANFRTQYYLTMAHGTGGTVTPASGWKNSGATVSITARPVSGYSFSIWTGIGTGSFSGTTNPASITMGGPITETATFTHN